MARPVIALLTDFGLQDHYVGVMKGVMLGICPEAALVDLSHAIPPQDITAAALELDASWQYFPAGTTFLVVVDPGVGSARRAIAIERAGRFFVGPDNGVLTPVTGDEQPWRGVFVTDPRYRLRAVSHTFEGRDRFAPAAAWLAGGVAIGELGAPIDTVTRIEMPRPRRSGAGVEGCVRRVDRFGNLITDITAADVAALARPRVEIGGRQIDGLVRTYADAAPHTLCALIGSTGCLEIAVSGGSAAAMLDLERGAPVRLLGAA